MAKKRQYKVIAEPPVEVAPPIPAPEPAPNNRPVTMGMATKPTRKEYAPEWVYIIGVDKPLKADKEYRVAPSVAKQLIDKGQAILKEQS